MLTSFKWQNGENCCGTKSLNGLDDKFKWYKSGRTPNSLGIASKLFLAKLNFCSGATIGFGMFSNDLNELSAMYKFLSLLSLNISGGTWIKPFPDKSSTSKSLSFENVSSSMFRMRFSCKYRNFKSNNVSNDSRPRSLMRFCEMSRTYEN